MPSNSSVLALFSKKTAAEPTTPKVDRESEVDFNDFLTKATHQVERTKKPSTENSTKNHQQNEWDKKEKIKPKTKNTQEKHVAVKQKPVENKKIKTKDSKYTETASKFENTTVTKTETTPTDSLKQNEVVSAKLKELGIKQDEFEALLEYLGFNGEVSFEALLNTLIQNLNGFTEEIDINFISQSELLSQLQKNQGEIKNVSQNKLLSQLLQTQEGKQLNGPQSELLSQLQKNQGEATHILKKAGLTEDQSKNLLNQLNNTTTNTNSVAVQNIEKNLDSSQSQLLAQLQKQEGEAIHILKKAGLTEDQSKNLLNQLNNTTTNTNSLAVQKEPDKTIEIKKDIQPQRTETDKKEIAKQLDQTGLFKNSVQGEKGNEPAIYIRPKDVSQKIEKNARTASLDKLPEIEKSAKIDQNIPSELKQNQGTKTFDNFNQVLQDSKSQIKLVQTEGGKDTLNFKGLESSKTGPDLQAQASNSAAENAIKTTQANRSVLPEKLIARGASETKIINQIINKLNVRTTGAQNEVHVKLDPPSLGTVRLNITTAGDSVRTVIIAENHAVKQTIESNFNQLRDAMNDQGLKVDSFSVTVGGESGNSNQSGKQMGEHETADHLNKPQTNASGNGDEFEEAHYPLVFDEDQSISVLA